MSEKYKSYNKMMITFTIPSTIQGKSIKKGRYTKLKYLLGLRAYLSKFFNNNQDIKYFSNIELGKAYSNPHLHIQLWYKDKELLNTIHKIYNKAINKFDLEKERCEITLPTHEKETYNYVIKDYAYSLTDSEVWNLETQKKRMRDQLGKQVRFYSRSCDKYAQSIYKIFFKHYRVLRRYANEFIDKFISMFFRKDIALKSNEWLVFSDLVLYIEQDSIFNQKANPQYSKINEYWTTGFL